MMNNELSVDCVKAGESSTELTRRHFGALSLAAGAMLALPTVVTAIEVNNAAMKPLEKPRVAARFPR
jgi:hypothetical protein